MSLPDSWRQRMRLPLICAPMYHVTTPTLVQAARRAGVMAALPRANAGSFDVFDRWLCEIMANDDPATSAPLAVNLSTRMQAGDMERHLDLCRRRGVELIISATGDPTLLIQGARDHGLKVFSDAVNLRFANKAIAAGADGIIAIGSGGGGHSGTVNHLTLVSAVRAMFDGTVVMAGAVTNGRAVRAAEILGADMAYMGTRFIATHESGAPPAYKRMLVDATAADLLYTPNVNGVNANWLKSSFRAFGLDPDCLPPRLEGARGHGHLPDEVVPWLNLWSAGQGVEEIRDIVAVEELVQELAAQYAEACAIRSFGS